MAKALEEDLEEEYSFKTGSENLKEEMKDLSRHIRNTMTAELGISTKELTILLNRTRKLQFEYDIIDKYWGGLESCLFEMSSLVGYMTMYPKLAVRDKKEQREKWNKFCITCRQYYNHLLKIEPDPATAEIEEKRKCDESMRFALANPILSKSPMPQESSTSGPVTMNNLAAGDVEAIGCSSKI